MLKDQCTSMLLINFHNCKRPQRLPQMCLSIYEKQQRKNKSLGYGGGGGKPKNKEAAHSFLCERESEM